MAGHKLTRDQEDYFAVLVTLIEQYERAHVPQPKLEHDPLGNLKFLMEQHGMNAADLGRLLGQRELGSKLVRGERENETPSGWNVPKQDLIAAMPMGAPNTMIW